MTSKPTTAAVAYLRRWQPGGPWTLTAICPNRGFIKTAGFGADDVEAMAAWIEQFNGLRNCYFQINPDLRPPAEITKKGRKEHVAAAVALQADVDAYKGDESPEAGRARALAQLTDPLEMPAGVPGPPTVINLSGNGFNALWRLREPVVLNGDLTAARAVELYNRGLAAALGSDADKTIDVNRIFRLPWTMNLPDKRKRDRGLQPVLAKQVSFDERLVYDLADFPRAALTPAQRARDPQREAEIAAGYRVGAAVGVADLDELDVPERTKIIIGAGAAPDEEKESRSEWLFAAITSMIRCGESDEVILGVITDPRWPISASVLEKPDPAAFAIYQVGRAHGWLTGQMEGDFGE